MQSLSLSEKEFALFQEFLVKESGLYFDKDRCSSLESALLERIQKRGLGSCQEYYNLLKSNTDGRLEIHELISLLTIGETYFFRNRPQFDALKRFVLPEIIKRKTNPSLNIWSAGCSRGDEPYSVAIAIMEVLPGYGDWDISILGTDINRNFIIAAKEAIYGKRDVNHLSEEQIDRYFHKRGTKYILNNKVKRLVRFGYHNMAKDPFTLEGMNNLDIILCRNVTIYFDTQTIKRVVNNFYDCLLRDGYLFIGHAETMWQVSDRFETVEFPQTFIYKKAVSHVGKGVRRPFIGIPEIRLEKFERPERRSPQPTKRIKPLEKERRVSKEVDREKLDHLYKEANTLYNEKRYEEAIALFDKIIKQNKNFTGAYLARATILANQAQYKEAIEELKKIITVDNLYVEAYYLLGVLSCKIRNLGEAETQFKKVIYINPEIALAYFNLGNIYLYQKKVGMAEREFKNAARLLGKRDKEETVIFSEDFTVDFLLRACKNNITEIKNKGR